MFWLLLLLVAVAVSLWIFRPGRAAHRAAGATVPVSPRPSASPPVKPAVYVPRTTTPQLGAVLPLPKPVVAPNPPPPATVASNPAPLVKPVPAAAALPQAEPYPRPIANALEAQAALSRQGISPGSIDGVMGFQTKLALQVFQRMKHLPVTGLLDAETRAALVLDEPLLTEYTVTSGDLARLQPVGKTWLEKSQQTALDYETEVELVGEYCHSSPALIRQLNPAVDWQNVRAGTVLKIPDIHYPDPPAQAAAVVIHLGEKFLEAFDESSNLLLHCPCSIAAHVEKRPVGLLHVVAVAPHPNYTFDPAVFPESPEAQKIGHKLILPPGPNNPVGVAWMSLDRPGYGMHGTPAPEQVGRTESHGCFRLANWDAEYMVKLVWVGLPVRVAP